jgi:hypothetical protein
LPVPEGILAAFSMAVEPGGQRAEAKSLKRKVNHDLKEDEEPVDTTIEGDIDGNATFSQS